MSCKTSHVSTASDFFREGIVRNILLLNCNCDTVLDNEDLAAIYQGKNRKIGRSEILFSFLEYRHLARDLWLEIHIAKHRSLYTRIVHHILQVHVHVCFDVVYGLLR